MSTTDAIICHTNPFFVQLIGTYTDTYFFDGSSNTFRWLLLQRTLLVIVPRKKIQFFNYIDRYWIHRPNSISATKKKVLYKTYYDEKGNGIIIDASKTKMVFRKQNCIFFFGVYSAFNSNYPCGGENCRFKIEDACIKDESGSSRDLAYFKTAPDGPTRASLT